jgi:hypothetical protein
MKQFLRSPLSYAYHGNAQSHHVRVMLGLSPDAKLPREGMAPRTIQGILVWVDPLPDRTPEEARRHHKRSTHRVRAKCPTCSKTLSVGRLHQHVCK